PAQRIAKCIRHSSGGLRFVDAAGIPLEGKAVVSLVVTDFQRTRLSRIFEMIEAEAAHLGVRIEYTRIVGLIPMQALLDTAAWKLRLSNFDSDQILETHLDQACRDLLDENTGAGFLDQLASTAPTPAGGSAAAFTAAQTAALLVMI
ncbi:MAG: cyclodeaminase/cyclohydrolase family protein, partial [Anaerolineaceae bacterium]